MIPILTSLLTLTHPAQERLATLPGSTSLPFTSGFFYFPEEPEISESAVRRGLWFFFLIRED